MFDLKKRTNINEKHLFHVLKNIYSTKKYNITKCLFLSILMRRMKFVLMFSYNMTKIRFNI